MRRKIFFGAVSPLLVLILSFSACSPNSPAASSQAVQTTVVTTTITSPSLQQPTTSITVQQPALPTITEVVAKVRPSVVAITGEVTTTAGGFSNQPSQAQAAGSGWIIRSDGYIVTNAHVVQGATNIVVTLSDGRTIPADKVYSDTVSDLGIVKINAQNLPAVTVGNSKALQVGDWVVAIGNALGQGISATKGIVSALNISLSPAPGQNLHGLIQTDAAINPGNSGGPLVNMAGQVIGITSGKITQVGVEGMGYAISIREATPIIDTLMTAGCIIRPYLGASVYTVDPTVAYFYGLPVNKGILITDVAQGSPADIVGLKPGDVITAIDGKEQTNDAEMMDYINSLTIGQKISVTYYRGNTQNTIEVTIVKDPNC